MSLKIKELPETERPYEKLELYGEKTLSNAELLAIIIKSGTKEETSVQIAQKILNLNYDPQMGSLNFLKEISDDIAKKATKIYEKQIKKNKVLPYHCDYRKLEHALSEYKKEEK